jgi:hypothetical protein
VESFADSLPILPNQEEVVMTDLNPPDQEGPLSRGPASRQSRQPSPTSTAVPPGNIFQREDPVRIGRPAGVRNTSAWDRLDTLP